MLPGLAAALIRRTVFHAAKNTSFYGELYRSIDLDEWSIHADLSELPFTNKAAIRAAGADAIDSALSYAAIQNTSGTTGKSLFLHRSQEEFDFIQEFFGELLSRNAQSTPSPLLLALAVPSHGSATPVPTNAFVLTTSVTSESGGARTAQYLETRFAIPYTSEYVSGISGGLWQVVALTGYLKSRAIPKPAQVSSIGVTGDHLSPSLRRWLESYWGPGSILNRYSLSEFFGGASQCARCGGFHFDPFLIPEIVPLGGGSSMFEGLGRLVLTGLNPFVQMQPLIRYLTDDVFERRLGVCELPSFYHHGRIGHSLVRSVDGAQELLLSALAIYDAVDSQTIVFRDDHSFALAAGTPGEGKPRFAGAVTDGADSLHLDLVVAYGGKLAAEITLKVASDIRAVLLATSPRLATMVTEGRALFSVRFAEAGSVRPGALKRDGAVW